MFWIFASTVAPAGGAGTLPLLPDPEPLPEPDPDELPDDVKLEEDDPVGVVDVPFEVDEEPEEPDEVPDEAVALPDVDDDPEELEEVAADDVADVPEVLGTAAEAGLAEAVIVVFDPPHPVMAKAAIARVPMAPNPFKFNCIRGPFRRWGADSQVKLGEHLLWMYTASCLSGLKN